MNKKLFFAGFALLAAVSFTSCNSDNPIDVTDPNGVRPATSTHYVGGSYDWTATPKNYAELQEFWAKDAKEVADLLKNNNDNVADILIDVTSYELAGETLTFPDFFAGNGGTSTANGKKVNITITGNFKNADFERANAIAKNDVAADMSKFPVRLDTKNLKGAEVNFTFNVEKFDLYLASTLTRSTFSGSYTIGYMKSQTAESLSALEVKEGTVEGLDVESTGDYKGSIDGVWAKANPSGGFNPYIMANASGLYGSFYDAVADDGTRVSGVTIPGASNIFIEKDVEIQTQYNPGGGNVIYPLGKVKFVQKKDTYARAYIDWNHSYIIESIEGTATKYSLVYVSDNALDDVEAVSKVTIPSSCTLTNDVFTDVRFRGTATFNTNDVAAFDNVQFDNARIMVGGDNAALSFNSVTFNEANAVDVFSGINVTNAADYYTYDYYQWVISDAAANQGKWVLYKSENGLVPVDTNIKEYNKDKAIVEFDKRYADVNAAGVLVAKVWGVDVSPAINLVKIGTYHPELVAYIIPEGTTIAFDSKCKFWNDLKNALDSSDRGLNFNFGHKNDSKDTWYNVSFGGKDYSWKKVNYGGTPATPATSTIFWDLIPPTE